MEQDSDTETKKIKVKIEHEIEDQTLKMSSKQSLLTQKSPNFLSRLAAKWGILGLLLVALVALGCF